MGNLKNQKYSKFKRYCKFLTLKEDSELIKKYKSYHNKNTIWPEITAGMKEVGILDMEIYIHNNTLCMIMETVQDFCHDTAMQELANKPRQKEWEQLMNTFQNSCSNSASGKWVLMERFFEM